MLQKEFFLSKILRIFRFFDELKTLKKFLNKKLNKFIYFINYLFI